MEAFSGQRSMATEVNEATEFNFEVRCSLGGHLEATMTSEATEMEVRGDMRIDTRVIEDADFKSEFKFDL